MENILLEKLKSLKLPSEDYAIFGSGPMFAHGIKDLGHDLDIIARGKAWELACKLGIPHKAKVSESTVVELFDGEIEIFDGWTSKDWNINELIDTADVIEGIRFVKLNNVVKWKEEMKREKDFEHIRLIKEFLSKHPD